MFLHNVIVDKEEWIKCTDSSSQPVLKKDKWYVFVISSKEYPFV